MIVGPSPFLSRISSLVGTEVASVAGMSRALCGTGADSFCSDQDLTRVGNPSGLSRGSALMGGLPLIGMEWDTFAGAVLVSGLAALLLRQVHKIWESKVRPFGVHTDINLLIHNWAVTDEGEARSMAIDMGRLFVRSVTETRNAYEHEYFQVPYTIDPKAWGEIGVRRNALTGRYVETIVGSFRDFGRGLSIQSSKDYGGAYRDLFSDFMDKIYLAIGPLTRWQDPPTDEDLHNFDHFQAVLRREIQALEIKMSAVPAQQAV